MFKGNLSGNPPGNLTSEKPSNRTISQKNVQLDLKKSGEPPGEGDNIVRMEGEDAAQWADNVDDEGWWAGLPAFHIPGRHFHKGRFVLTEIIDDNMYPTMPRSDWVIARELPGNQHFKEGHVHIVLTRDGPACHRLFAKKGAKKVALCNDNSNYPDSEIASRHILACYEAICRISYSFHLPHLRLIDELYREMRQINRELMTHKPPTTQPQPEKNVQLENPQTAKTG